MRKVRVLFGVPEAGEYPAKAARVAGWQAVWLWVWVWGWW